MEQRICTRCKHSFPLDHFRSDAKPNLTVKWCSRCRAWSRQNQQEKFGHQRFEDYRKPAGWCFRCKQVRPIDEFYVAPSQKRGYSTFCKACVGETTAAKSRDFRDKMRESEDGKARLRSYRYTEYRNNMSDDQRKVRLYARHELQRAIREGEIVRQPCEVCGDIKAHGHHDDYAKPLEVRWLCRTHHNEVHRHR